MSDLPPVNENSPLSSLAGPREVRIVTGSRLHFGLLDTVDPFGGVGVMIDRPATEVIVRSAERFEYCGPRSGRALEIATRVSGLSGLGSPLPACQIQAVSAAPPHRGLGSGTQLLMAIAEGICRCLGIPVDADSLATDIAARGKRSAVGIHGYYHGGLIFETSSRSGRLNEIQQRVELPGSWCVAVLGPSTQVESVHGIDEVEKFARIPAANSDAKQELRRIVRDEIMPSAIHGDFESFSIAIRNYNRASGMLFASIQGGPYNGGEIEALVQWLTDRGVTGVGQSSWGPGVFAWFESIAQAEPVVGRLPDGVELIALARAKNEARTLRLTAENPGAS